MSANGRGVRRVYLGDAGAERYTRNGVTIAYGPDEYDPGFEVPQDFPRRQRRMLRFHFTNQHRWRNARVFEIPDQTVSEFFPRLNYLGPEAFMDEDTFMVDRFCCSRVFEYQIPPEELVEAYNFILPILIRRRPIFAEMQIHYSDLRRRNALKESCTLFVNLSYLLSNERGFGAGGWLQEDFAEASVRLWEEAGGSLRQEKRIDMFLSNLEPFASLFSSRHRDQFGLILNRIRHIWADFDRETQLSIRDAADWDAEVLDTGCAIMVRRAVESLAFWSSRNIENNNDSARGRGQAQEQHREDLDARQHNDDLETETLALGETDFDFPDDHEGRERGRFLWRRGPEFYLTRHPGGRWEVHEYEDAHETQRARDSSWTAGPGFDRIPRTRGPKNEYGNRA